MDAALDSASDAVCVVMFSLVLGSPTMFYYWKMELMLLIILLYPAVILLQAVFMLLTA